MTSRAMAACTCGTRSWRFGSSARHGIDFRIATWEPWEDDSEQDVAYDVASIAVDSPSGAPDTFTQTLEGWGSEESIERIRRLGPDRAPAVGDSLHHKLVSPSRLTMVD